jgi:hypothetical protein
MIKDALLSHITREKPPSHVFHPLQKFTNSPSSAVRRKEVRLIEWPRQDN